MNEVYEFLKKYHVYYLATLDGNQPRVRPFGTIDLFEGNLYIQTGKKKDVSKQMHVNPNVEICAFGDGKWLRIACKAVEYDSVEARKHMLDNHSDLRRMYDENDGNCEVFRLTEATATFSSFTEAPKTVEWK